MISIIFHPSFFWWFFHCFFILDVQPYLRIPLPLDWRSVSSVVSTSVLASVYIINFPKAILSLPHPLFFFASYKWLSVRPKYKVQTWFWRAIIIQPPFSFISNSSATKSDLYFLISLVFLLLLDTYSILVLLFFQLILLNIMCWIPCWVLLTSCVLLILAGKNVILSIIILFLFISKTHHRLLCFLEISWLCYGGITCFWVLSL